MKLKLDNLAFYISEYVDILKLPSFQRINMTNTPVESLLFGFFFFLPSIGMQFPFNTQPIRLLLPLPYICSGSDFPLSAPQFQYKWFSSLVLWKLCHLIFPVTFCMWQYNLSPWKQSVNIKATSTNRGCKLVLSPLFKAR